MIDFSHLFLFDYFLIINMNTVKIKILKTRTGSGYFSNRIIEVDQCTLEEIQKYNEIQILEEPEAMKQNPKKKSK